MALLANLLVLLLEYLFRYLSARVSYKRLFSMVSGIVVVHHGCCSVLLSTHHPTIYYTPPRFILKDPWTAAKLGNPPKPVLIRIPRVTLGWVEGQDADQQSMVMTRNIPKQVVVRDIMINPKANLGLTRGW